LDKLPLYAVKSKPTAVFTDSGRADQIDLTSPASIRSVDPVIQRAPGDTRNAISSLKASAVADLTIELQRARRWRSPESKACEGTICTLMFADRTRAKQLAHRHRLKKMSR
jgi:hypothetical protein